MNNFILRTLTGVAFVAVLIGCTVYSPLTFAGLFCIISMLATREFCTLMNSRDGIEVNTVITTMSSGLLFIALFATCTDNVDGFIYLAHSVLFYLPYALTIIYLLVAELYLKHEDPIGTWACTMMSQLYIALPFALLNLLAFNTEMSSRFWLFPLSTFVFIWASDTGAYCVGSLLHNVFPAKLFPRISPKKSWIGSIGGGVIAMLIGALIWYLTNNLESDSVCSILTLPEWLGFALVVTVFGTWGDLVESLIKRTLGIKDSGNILPGHGGMLDRFDSSLLAIPATAVYLYTILMFNMD